VLQLRVELPPELMLDGLAVNEVIDGNTGGGNGAEATVIVTDLFTVPALLLAVNVYVAVEDGRAVALPELDTYPPPRSR
jgi:hypothetical protein